jgi:hypothetical protein
VPTPTPNPTPTPPPPPITINIIGMSFSPDPANVQVGQEIRWHNGDIFAHTATSTGGIDFDTVPSPAAPAARSSLRAGAGRCSFHTTMVATLNVTPDAAADRSCCGCPGGKPAQRETLPAAGL